MANKAGGGEGFRLHFQTFDNARILFAIFITWLITHHVMASQVRNSEVRPSRTSQSFFWLIPTAAVLCLVLITAALWFWGAREVRGHVNEVFFLTLVGVLWLVVAMALFPWFGLSIRDDAWERKNPAAAIALACALLSVAITFAAGNLGEGPSYWENIFCAGLATGGLFALWIALEIGAHISISIAEERDLASGFRFGGLLLAWGLILARAATGNWHSCAQSVHDFFRDGWTAALLFPIALILERLLRPSRLRPFPNRFACGIIPALLYLAAAAGWFWHLGRWEGMPT